jgi:taurine dioxygenase
MTKTTDTPHQIQISPTGGPLGAEIRGVDLAQPLPEATVKAVRQALLDHCVVFFRRQVMSEEDQVRFTGYFGQPVEHVRKQPERKVKEIFIVSNVTKDGKPIGALGNDEILFHSDLAYMPQPGTLSLLYAVEVPKTGGATQWANGYAAYDALDDSLKTRLKGLRAIHRHPIESQNPPEPVAHPVAIRHPETGRKALYISPHFTKYIVGLSEVESQEMLDALLDHVVQPRFVWTHDWQAGDLVMWDNRCTLHRREPFPATERRIMKRTQIFNAETPRE